MKTTVEEIEIFSEYLSELKALLERKPERPTEEEEERARTQFKKKGTIPRDLKKRINFRLLPGEHFTDIRILPGYETEDLIKTINALTDIEAYDKIAKLEGVEVSEGEEAYEVEYPELNAWYNELLELYRKFEDGPCKDLIKDFNFQYVDNYNALTSPLLVARKLSEIEENFAKANQNLWNFDSPVPKMPNSALTHDFLTVLATGPKINGNGLSNGYKAEPYRNSGFRIIHETGNYKAEFLVKDRQIFDHTKTNKNVIVLFCYILQLMALQNYPDIVYIDLSELVRIGMYSSIEGARHGVDSFYEQMQGNFLYTYVDKKGSGSVKGSKVPLFGKMTYGTNSRCIHVYEEFDFSLFAGFMTYLPVWVYNRNISISAFKLARAISYLARQNGRQMKEVNSHDFIPGRKTFTFRISMETIRKELGLPSPDYTKEHFNRKYNEKIIKPIEDAILVIEDAIKDLTPEEAFILTLTPIGTDAAANIHEYLNCELEVGIYEAYAQEFINIANKRQTKLTELEAAVMDRKAKNMVSKKKSSRKKKSVEAAAGSEEE